MDLNKISVKQQGGQMIPNQPGMQQQPQVDPAIQQVSVFFKESIEQGGKPEEVVMGLMQQEVDQNTIVQALMSLGYQENDLQVLFQNIQEQQQVADPTPQQINQNPQQLARQQEIQEDQEGLNVNIDPVEIAKSGIEIKPENEGKFTAWAKARGMSVQEAAKKVMANKDRYPTRIVKMANFAKNAAGWNKAQDGVEIQKLSPDGRSIITERDGMTILKDNPWDNQDAKSQLQDIETQIKLLQQQAAIAKAQAQHNAEKALLNEQKEGGEFKPHFMYKGDRKIRAKDMETHLRLKEAGYTHDVPKAQTGNEMIDSAYQFANKNNITVKDSNDNILYGGQDVVNDNDDGIINNPFYISPSAFHTGKRFSPASLVNSVVDFGTTLFGGQDKDNDGLKDGSLRDLKNKTIANKAKKYADADYTVNLDLSDENVTNFQNWMTQYQKENPTLKDAISNLPTPNIETNKPEINNVVEEGKKWLSDNIGNLGSSAQGVYDALKNKISGVNPKKQFGNGESTSNEFDLANVFQNQTDYMADTQAVADSQLQQRFPDLGPTPLESETQVNSQQLLADAELDADSLFDKVDFGSVDVDTGGVFGALKRGYNSNAMRAFEDIAGKGIGIISNINDWKEDADDSGYVDARQNIIADNAYATKTDPQFKKGKGPDINTGLFGSDADRVTGYYMKNGGTNNPGFKALPKSVQANILQNMQGGGVPGEQIPGMPTKEQLDLLVYMNNYKNSFMADGYKPSQSEFDAMDQKTKEMYAQTFPGNYKISSDTPTREELNAITNKMQMGGGGIPGQQIPGMPTKAQLDAITGANEIQFVPGTSQYKYLASLPEQSVDFQLPNFVKDSSYNQMLVTRLFKDSELMELPSQSKNFQLNNFEKMQMGGNPFNPLKLFTDDLEEYQKKGETPVRSNRSRSEIESEMAELQRQIDNENSRVEGFRSNIDKIYRGILTSKEVDDEQQRKAQLAEILGPDSSIDPALFNTVEGDYGRVVGLDSIPAATLNWGSKLYDSGEGYGCTSYGCGILRKAGATTAEGKPFPIISGNSQLNSMIERNDGGLGMQLMEPGFSDLLPGDRVVSNYSTSGGSGEAHTMIFTGDYDENGSPIMMENTGGNWKTGVDYRPLSEIKRNLDLSDPDSGLRVTRYVGSTSDLNNQLSALQSDIDNRNYKRDLAAPLNISLNPAPISMSETLLPKAELLPELLPVNNYGGERGEAAYLANRDRVIKRELSKAQTGIPASSLPNVLGRSMMANPMMKKLLNLSPSSEAELIDIYNGAKNISNISEGLEFFNNVKKDDIKRYLDESGIDKKEVRKYVENQPFYDDANWATKQGIKLAMKMKGLKQGGEIINVDPKMLAKLIAAGADIEML